MHPVDIQAMLDFDQVSVEDLDFFAVAGHAGGLRSVDEGVSQYVALLYRVSKFGPVFGGHPPSCLSGSRAGSRCRCA